MFDQTYKTPEGFELHRPLLLPDARSFADVLEYVREWDYETMNVRNGDQVKRPDLVPAPRYIKQNELGCTLAGIAGFPRSEQAQKGNEIGPFCTIDMRQLGGESHRSIAVRATDAVIEAVRERIVTDDDHLSFSLIAHEGSGRVLVILQHGQISGSHYIAYIDPATIPAYPLKARDEAKARVRAEMEAEGFQVMHGTTGEPYEVKLRRFKRESPYWRDIYSGPWVVVDAEGNVR